MHLMIVRLHLWSCRNILLENDSAEKVARCLVLPLETVQQLADELHDVSSK